MAERGKNNASGLQKKQQRQRGHERRRSVGALLLILCGIILLLSIVSFSRGDESLLDRLSVTDIFRLLYNPEVKAQVALLHNHLGFIGALLSNFFIVSTIGYFSLVFPSLLILWGWILLFRRSADTSITFTNYALLLGVITSTLFGISNLAIGNIGKEWSGMIGAFLADLLVKLLGLAGASIIIFFVFCLTVIFAIDLDVHKSLTRFEQLWKHLKNLVGTGNMAAENIPEEAGEREVTIRTFPEETQPMVQDRPQPEILQQEDETEIVDGDEEIAGDEKIPSREEDNHIDQDVPRPAPERPPVIPDEEKEIDYVFPSVELLDAPRQSDTIPEDELKANAELVRAKLANFGVEIESVSVTPGPVITLYELVPASGVKISRIVSLADDLALALAAKGIRIMAPIPGKSAVGVEIPNRNPSMVYLRSVINSAKFRESKAYLPLALGKTISGDIYTDDLTKMPHLLIAGSTGSGKSVGINTILASLLFRLHPSDVKFVIIDPKKIELTNYARLKHHFLAVSPDIDEEIITTPENAVHTLKGAELEMEKRYDRLAAAGVRNIQDYNERLGSGRLKNTETVVHRKMPYLIVVIDELADLMMTAAREVEEPIARLAQLARAVGIHLVLATQRPSVDVITGVIKANFPARIAYQVASKTDSRTILDMNGAEQLLGSGDMLYLPAGSPKPIRIQNAFISSDEVERITDHVARQQGYSKPFMLPSNLEKKRSGLRGGLSERDEFFEEAARIIVRHQQGSVSLLQRRLKVGYSRAARLVDELEAAGIVGPFDGSKAREVLIETDDELDTILESL
jgi:S-DNA-T family DNA segregation ATPase FtsK/SpoIIIE